MVDNQWSTDNFASIMGSQSVGSGANSATITNLSTSTQYNIRIYATNAIGNSVFSNIISVTTTELSPITPFSISIINPTDNSTIKGKTIVSIESNVPVKRVEVYFDSTLKKVLSGSLNYQFNTRGISSGVHVILVKAFDSLGRTDTDSVSVNIN